MAPRPYYRGRELSEVFNWTGYFYSAMLQEILFKAGGLDMVCRYLSIGKPRPWLTYLVLKHISLRTLQYSKPFELIRHSEIIEGRPDIAIFPCPVKPRWLKQVLSGLVAGQWIIKLTLPRTVTTSAFYGFHIPGWLWMIRKIWTDSLHDEGYSAKLERLDLDWIISNSRALNPRPYHSEVLSDCERASGMAKRGLYMLGVLVRFVTPYCQMFGFVADQGTRPIRDWDAFLDDLRDLRPSRGEIDISNRSLMHIVRNCRIGREGSRENSHEDRVEGEPEDVDDALGL